MTEATIEINELHEVVIPRNVDLWRVEHSRYSEENQMYPFHLGTLQDAVKCNLRHFKTDHRGPNRWEIVFVGTLDQCSEMIDALTQHAFDRGAPVTWDRLMNRSLEAERPQ